MPLPKKEIFLPKVEEEHHVVPSVQSLGRLLGQTPKIKMPLKHSQRKVLMRQMYQAVVEFAAAADGVVVAVTVVVGMAMTPLKPMMDFPCQ